MGMDGCTGSGYHGTATRALSRHALLISWPAPNYSLARLIDGPDFISLLRRWLFNLARVTSQKQGSLSVINYCYYWMLNSEGTDRDRLAVVTPRWRVVFGPGSVTGPCRSRRVLVSQCLDNNMLRPCQWQYSHDNDNNYYTIAMIMIQPIKKRRKKPSLNRSKLGCLFFVYYYCQDGPT